MFEIFIPFISLFDLVLCSNEGPLSRGDNSDFFYRTNGPNLRKLGINHPQMVKGIQVCSNERCRLFQENNNSN